jgi:predicted CoA-substrate-specific enzyme activase
LIYAGCDLGTVTAKVVIIENDSILASEIIAYKTLPRQAVAEVFKKTTTKSDLSVDQIDYFTATGFGRKAVEFADDNVSEIVAVNRAIRLLNGDVRTVVDVGGQSITAFNIGKKGRIIDSAVNEKCAAGTGKFMDVMAKALEMPLKQLNELALFADNIVPITSQCGVFAESEVITYVNDGKERADIFAGIARSVAAKISSLVRRIDVLPPLALVGGVAKNAVVQRDVEDELRIKVTPLEIDLQIVGALGAALVAKERHKAKQFQL